MDSESREEGEEQDSIMPWTAQYVMPRLSRRAEKISSLFSPPMQAGWVS